MSETPAIRTTGLRKVYRRGGADVVALDGVDLTVPRGQVFGVLGTSGAGKSTLIRTVNGLERATAGSVEVGGVELTRLRGAALREQRRKIGMVFQHFNLLTSRTAAQNVALPLEIVGVDRRERRERAQRLLELVGLGDQADAYPAQLSGGQKQRVGIARALAAEPSVLLSDEATSALDEQTAASVLALLRDLNERLGLTIVLVTHQLSVVKQMADAAVLLRDGRAVDAGTLADAAARPTSPLGRVLLPALPDDASAADARRDAHAGSLGGAADGSAAADGRELLDLVVVGDAARGVVAPLDAAADEPVRAALRAADVRYDVLAAVYEPVGGRPVARLRLALAGTADARAGARRALAAAGANPQQPVAETVQEPVA
ncbi:methionine ABC transporter ATP-binding protein [Conexibacter woesei]|uniref:ABC transporter related protein n=1 Tax=Conexibacter woesei (strain DSM 14684 / CCUG 47730 / CIP 108061 / JCM 11494 / NBRC 100937 / ID131577) TaxID=469383 RepID=D3F633_CONWI|nr:ATP-binding cassette domain-containing protein [Conexibacter woesei]ADB48706.1 ABC transporter related protein [Conexibacter woesei DSM 14684]